jgi:hypothetical protein
MRPSGRHARNEPGTHQDALERVDVVFAHHAVDVDRVYGAPVHARAARLERERGRRVRGRIRPRRVAPGGDGDRLRPPEVPSRPTGDDRRTKGSPSGGIHTRGDDDTRTSRRAARNVGARHARTRSAARPRRATTRECFGLSEAVSRTVQRSDFRASRSVRPAFRERLDEKRIHRDQSLARSTLNPTLHPVSRATRREPASGNDMRNRTLPQKRLTPPVRRSSRRARCA